MNKKSRQDKDNILFENDETYIKIQNNKLLVINKNTLDRDTFAIRVCSGFYIELGRHLNDFKRALMEVDIPIVFEKITSVYGYTHYNIVRMETDNVDDLVLGTLICKDGIIEKITCDSSYKTREDFNKYDSIGAIWRGGSFSYSNSSIRNQEEAKRVTLALMSLNMHTANNNIEDNFLFSPLTMGETSELEKIKTQIRKDNIESEIEFGDMNTAYSLIDEEINDEINDEIFDDTDILFSDPNEYEDNISKELNDTLDNNENYQMENDNFGDIEIKTTYSTVKIEVSLKDISSNREYKFTFILNEISKLYELISITLV